MKAAWYAASPGTLSFLATRREALDPTLFVRLSVR